ncbi:preprotein translocase subunit SecG [Sulfuriferula thiophila]|uniref:preprotein translocase subunit SecG n=1 Tax=Sulfuriferula thiophila TaxID=1781211 RepID=UPI000F60DAD7|nr:preprotein translocase subunit SecG [Sulfuriferula thiophila]
METIIWILHLLAAVSVIVLVLLQQGKGADMGASFGSGASGSLFGSTGSANFLSRTTAVLAASFFMTSLVLTYFSGHQTRSAGVMQTQQKLQVVKPVAPVGSTVPAAPAGQAVPGNAGSKAGEIPK